MMEVDVYFFAYRSSERLAMFLQKDRRIETCRVVEEVVIAAAKIEDLEDLEKLDTDMRGLANKNETWFYDGHGLFLGEKIGVIVGKG